MMPEQKAAYIMAMTAGMLAELEAMKVNNAASERAGDRYLPHAPAEFLALVDKHGLSHNGICTFFQD